MQKHTFTLRNDVFSKHILFSKDSTITVKAQDFEYSLGRLIDEKSSISWRMGCAKCRKFQSPK
jgi:hypothetical protein